MSGQGVRGDTAENQLLNFFSGLSGGNVPNNEYTDLFSQGLQTEFHQKIFEILSFPRLQTLTVAMWLERIEMEKKIKAGRDFTETTFCL